MERGFNDEEDKGLFTFYRELSSEQQAAKQAQNDLQAAITRQNRKHKTELNKNKELLKNITIKKYNSLLSTPHHYRSMSDHNKMESQGFQNIQRESTNRKMLSPALTRTTIYKQPVSDHIKKIFQINLNFSRLRKNTISSSVRNKCYKNKTQSDENQQKHIQSIKFPHFLNSTYFNETAQGNIQQIKDIYKHKKDYLYKLQAYSNKNYIKMKSIISKCFIKKEENQSCEKQTKLQINSNRIFTISALFKDHQYLDKSKQIKIKKHIWVPSEHLCEQADGYSIQHLKIKEEKLKMRSKKSQNNQFRLKIKEFFSNKSQKDAIYLQKLTFNNIPFHKLSEQQKRSQSVPKK